MAAPTILKITILVVSRPFFVYICTDLYTETKDAVLQPDLKTKFI